MDFVVLVPHDVTSTGLVKLPQQHAVEGLVTVACNCSDHQGCAHFARHLRDGRGSVGVPQRVHIGGIFWPHDDVDVLSVQWLRYPVVIGEVVSPVVIREQAGFRIALHGQYADGA